MSLSASSSSVNSQLVPIKSKQSYGAADSGLTDTKSTVGVLWMNIVLHVKGHSGMPVYRTIPRPIKWPWPA